LLIGAIVRARIEEKKGLRKPINIKMNEDKLRKYVNKIMKRILENHTLHVINEDKTSERLRGVMIQVNDTESVFHIYEKESLQLQRASKNSFIPAVVCCAKREEMTDKQYLEFLNDLRKLNKNELVDLIGDYWITLKQSAEYDRKQKDVYMAVGFGNIKLTEVNRLKNLAIHKSRNK